MSPSPLSFPYTKENKIANTCRQVQFLHFLKCSFCVLTAAASRMRTFLLIFRNRKEWNL